MNWSRLGQLVVRLAKTTLEQAALAQSISAEMDRLRAGVRYQDKRCLVPFGHKIYSQTDEDGITLEIFKRIGVTNRTFVEFGVGDGLENNTLALLFDGWTGLWIEGSKDYVKRIREGFPTAISSKRLQVKNAFITTDNIDALISEGIRHPEVDLLSVDIDGNDFHVFNAIRRVRPRVVILEYNAKFAPPLQYCMAYNPGHVWRANDDCFGASLKFLEVRLGKCGYCLVACNLAGTNAFFVRQDLIGDRFLAPYTAEQHYEPARYYLCSMPSGHAPSYRTLEHAMLVDHVDELG